MTLQPYHRILRRLGALIPSRARALQSLLAVSLAWLAPALQARELLVVGGHFEHIFERNRDGQYVGLGPDIVRAAAARMGHTVRFQQYPWSRAQLMLVEGRADILVGAYKTAKREEQMGFSRWPFFQDNLMFYVRSDRVLAWDGDYSLLKNKRIAVLNGWTYGDQFDQARSMLDITVATNIEGGLQMLAHGHADLLATNRRTAEPAISMLNLGDEVRPLARAIQTQAGYFAFSRDHDGEALRASFDQACRQLDSSGELKKMARRSGSELPSHQDIPAQSSGARR